MPLSAVKYYQREGLLPEGVRSAPNQVAYGEAHVKRVRLIRALLETGGLSIAAAKDVVSALDAPETPLVDTFGVAQHAMSTPRGAESGPTQASRDRVAALARARGWAVTNDNPGLDAAARALDGLATIGFEAPDDYLAVYADAATAVAAVDMGALAPLSDADQLAELMVVGTVLGDPLFAGLRRLAHQHSARNLVRSDTRRARS